MTASLRVLNVFRTLDAGSGGPLTYLETLSRACEPLDIAVSSAAMIACRPPTSLRMPAHVGQPGSDAANAFALWRWLRGAIPQHDVVHIHGVFGWHFLAAAALCQRVGKPYVLSSHGLLSDWYLGTRTFRKRAYLALVRPLLRQAAVTVTMTAMEHDFIRALDRRMTLRLVRPGVVPEPFARRADPPPLRILFLGRLSRVKGLPLLLSAIAEVRRGGVDVELEVAGSGSRDYGETGLARDVATFGIVDCVRTVGLLDASARETALRRAHVLALPSYSENFSFATAEALAAGIPVVVSDAVGMHDLVLDRQCGVVVPVGNASALVQALTRFTDRAFRERCAHNALACARDDLGLQQMGVAMKNLYLEAARRPQTAAS